MTESLPLKCPLCCEESFPSHHSLKYHILSLTENLICPSCDKRFYNLYELTDHLGRQCNDEHFSNNDPLDGQNFYKSDSINVSSQLLVPKVEVAEYEEINFCYMCNINILSVEEHLETCHQGENIIMEPDLDNETDHDYVPLDSVESEDATILNEDDDTENYIVDYNTNNQTLTEQECTDKDGRAYTRKVIKINKFWIGEDENIAPIVDDYIIDGSGKIRKIQEGEHVDKDSTITIYQCPHCYLQFPLLDHFKKHICNPIKNNNKFKCIHCSKIYDNYESLNMHIKTHLTLEKYSGEVKRVITMEPYKCDICNTKFPSYRNLRLHQRMHEPVKDQVIQPPVSYSISGPDESRDDDKPIVRRMFICNICNNTYDKEYEEVHMKSHSGQENYNCTICNRKFYTKENLEMHSKAHKPTTKFACTYCKKAFTTYESLTEHVSSQCQQRQYECQYCGRRFLRPHEKVKHERIHTGEKPHVCQICGKAFRVSYCLTLHLRTHSGTRPYKCSHCGKRFKSHSVYNHHMLTHSNVRGYKCPYCPKAFKTSVQLAGHKNSHIKPFTCNECNRPFSSLYAVRAHMESHKRDNNLRYDCWQCGAVYGRAYALRDHMKTHIKPEDATLGDKVLTEMETVQSTTSIENQMEMEDEQQNYDEVQQSTVQNI